MRCAGSRGRWRRCRLGGRRGSNGFSRFNLEEVCIIGDGIGALGRNRGRRVFALPCEIEEGKEERGEFANGMLCGWALEWISHLPTSPTASEAASYLLLMSVWASPSPLSPTFSPVWDWSGRER